MKKIFITIIAIGFIFAISSCASTSHCDAYGNVEHKTDNTEVMS